MAEVSVFIAVFRGEPLDYQHTRHTSLWFRFSDDSAPITIHAAGPPRVYRVETEDNDDPAKDAKLAGLIQVGLLLRPMSKPQLVHLLYQVPVNNETYDFNCQTWVGDALDRLQQEQLLSQDDRQKGIDAMVDLILEATDSEDA